MTKGPGEARRDGKAPEWTFHEEPSGLVKGHDAGLYTFEHAGEGGWIRELLQNSLDARANPDDPVEIEINAQQVASGVVDARGLRETVRCCQRHPERLGKVSSLFDQAVDTLDQPEITAICYSESNTTGAKVSDGTWLALTRSEGISGNKSAAAMGSYGIGKNAGVAASPLHAVVYSTRYYDEKEGMVRRAVGRAILVSHESEDGELRQPFGWLGTRDDNGKRGSDLIGDDIPESLRRRTTGLSIWILGRDLGERASERLAHEVAVHYFPAVHAGALAVLIGRKKVNAGTLRGCFRLNKTAGVSGPYALRGLDAIANGKVFEQRIPGVGNVRLHVRCEEPGTRPIIFLVRGAGLVLTRNVTDMGPARPPVVDTNLVPYTAVLHVTEPQEGDSGWLRESETPAHDKISTSLIREPESRNEANRRLREMAEWAASMIQEVAGRTIAETSRNAIELAHFLPAPSSLFGEDSPKSEKRSSEGQRFQFTDFREITSRVGGTIRSTGDGTSTGEEEIVDSEGTVEPTRRRSNGGGGGGDGDGDWNGDGDKTGKPTRARIRRACSGVRIHEDPNDTTHGLIVSFQLPDQGTGKLDLCTLGEDGTKDRIRLTSVKWEHGGDDGPSETEATVSGDGSTFDLPTELAGKRVKAKIKTMEPVTGAGLVLQYEHATEGQKS